MDPASSTNRPWAASIVIPAHNEGAVVARLLGALPREVNGKPIEVLVACNGCTDNTAQVARGFDVSVLEIEAPSKIAALNAADAAATAYPRLYVDADIGISARAVADLVQALGRPGALCAAPPSRMNFDRSPWLVRAYFSFWQHLMQVRQGYVGAGVYALSRAGRSRFGEFPNIIADDMFVRSLFLPPERQTVPTDPTIVEAPRTVGALFRRRVRVCMGNIELAWLARRQSLPGLSEASAPWWRIALQSPRLVPASIVYASFNGLARLAVAWRIRTNQSVEWGHDKTTRASTVTDTMKPPEGA